MKELNLDKVELKDIKTNKITLQEIDEMAKLSGSFESLFSRRALKYKSLNLASKYLKEDDYKNYILKEYTFLKRPILITQDKIVIGNSKKAIEDGSAALKESLKGEDIDDIKKKTEALVQSSMKLGEAIYKSQQNAKPDSGKDDGKDEKEKKDDNVVDADFEEVKDENKEKSA